MTENLIRLTQTVKKGGCAAKVAAVELRDILARVKFPKAPQELLVDSGSFDDAAVFQINEELALVQTLDFFTPIVDRPADFGAIASANALSDVYAMGATPVTAMSVLAFPLGELPNSVISEILQAAVNKCEEAGANLVGGHSIDDESLKFGLSVTGFVHPKEIWTNQGAKVGDVLILTKPLGTGTLMAGLKKSFWNEADVSDAIASMQRLNRLPQLLSAEERRAVHAATDITGFGLAGHALHIAKGSEMSLHFDSKKIPLFSKTLESLKNENLTKAHRTNREYVEGFVCFPDDPLLKLCVLDPQTSGGLLLSVEAKFAEGLLLKARAVFPEARVVGRVSAREERSLFFEER